MLTDFVCYRCQAVLASEREDGSWKIRLRARINGKWRTVNEWQQRFVCPDCRAEGVPNASDTNPTKGHGRIRIPIRPLM